MTMEWITPDQVFDGQHLRSGVAVGISKGRVAALSDAPRHGPRVAGCLTPGFLDLQVNGGGGEMLNSTPTPDGIATIAAAHRRFGTVGILPTVITDAPTVLEQAAEAALAAKDQPGILGLHIEGPHIALARRGTHKGAFVRPMADQTITLVERLRMAGLRVMLTLAPEAATTDQISALADLGAVVSIGHTDASAEAVEAAIAAGAGCATHLFNAMSPMTSRAPGAVGGVLNADIFFGIICDGHHVDDRMIRLALRAAGRGRAFAVSDAMATVGGPVSFDLYGAPVRLQHGRLINDEGGLAGAHFTQAEAVARLVQSIGLTLEDALYMVVTNPARVIGAADLANLNGRAAGDVVLLSPELTLSGTLDHIMQNHQPSDAAE